MKEYLTNYEVHRNGQVERVSMNGSNQSNAKIGHFLKPEITKNGYQRVTLCYGGKTKRFLLHRLIALVHIPNPENKPCVNHIDGNKLNNSVENLEWVTFSENEFHSYRVLGKIAYKSPLFNK